MIVSRGVVSKLVSVTLSLSITFFSSLAYSGSQTGTVYGLTVRDYDGLHYFYVTGTEEDKPTCATSPYWMIKDETSSNGKAVWQVLLAAALSGKTITVSGTGGCSRWVDGEDVGYITVHLE